LGGVGSTPIERVSRNGQPYATFTMYTNIDTVKKNGEVFQSTEMHGVMAFGNLARYVTNNVEKGIYNNQL
jgi:single-stranded DNA-binding protein